MRQYAYIFLFIFYSIGIKAGTLDSLRHIESVTNNDTVKIRALNEMAKLYVNINNDTAILLSNEALLLSKEQGIVITEIESYKELGIINIYKGKFTRAISLLNKALLKATKIKEQENIAQIYYLLGISYYNIDKYNKAIQKYSKSLFIAQQNNFKNIKLNCYNAIGVSNKAMGNYDKAIEYYFKSLKQAQEQNNQEAISNAYNNIGVIYKFQKLYDDAIAFYQKAYDLNAANHNEYNLMQINQNLGVVYKLKGDYATALEYYKKALDIAFKIDSKSGKAKVYSNIAILLKRQKKYNKAISKLQQAMQYAIDIEDRSGQASNYITLGQIYLTLYDSLGKYTYLQKALSSSLQAYKISDEIKVKEDTKSSSLLLKDIYNKLGNYRESLKYANIFIKLNEELDNKNKLNVIKNLKQKYETEKNQLLIEKLQKEQSLRNQKIKTQSLRNTIRQRQIRLLIVSLILLSVLFIYILFNLKKNKKLNIKIEEKSNELKKQYLKSVKQNIEIKTKEIEQQSQKQIIIQNNNKLQDLNSQLKASEEELTQQNEVLHQRNEEILKQRERIGEVVQQFQDTIENMEDIYFKTDKHFVYQQVSPSIEKHLQLQSYTEIIGKPFKEFWNIKDNDFDRLTSKLLEKQHIKNVLFEYKTTNNETKFGKINARVIYKDGEFNGVEGIIRDITKDIESQKKINEVIRQFEDTIENMEDIYFKTDENFIYQQVSPSIEKHLQLQSYTEIIGKPFKEFWNIKNKDFEHLTSELLEKQHVKDVLFEYKTTDSKAKFGKINARVIYKDGKFNGVEGIIRDVTKDIESQKKIKEAIRQFEDTIENMEDVFFQADKNFIQTKISPSIKKYLKLDSLDQIIGKPLTEFWNITNQELKDMTREIIRNGFIKEMLFEYKTTDNKIGFAKVNARALYDKNNKIRGVEGIIRDITKDIEAQRKIKELNTQKEVLINNIPSSIYYKDINLRYLAVNNNFAEKLGKPINEILGKTDEELALSETTIEYKELDKKVITTKEPILNYVKEYTDANDDPYWISISKIPYLDVDNNVAGVIGVVQDITEQIKHDREIRESKDKIEKAHKHITDNINYARGIQQALLPSSDMINSYFKDYFVFFKSKEQVSGDFYYFNQIGKEIIFTAADCTGHGVSGGFLTMLGITHLNEIVSKNEIDRPEEILNSLREKIKNTYKLFGTETQDGLDIALCTLNTETNILRYSGAYNPLWIIRNNELVEYKATRNPIGFYINEVNFKGYEIQLQKNDMIYVFSDGFVDQFGGGIDKKYTVKRFKKFLLSINHLSIKNQKSIMSNEFNDWKGDEEQTDDVLVMGIRI